MNIKPVSSFFLGDQTNLLRCEEFTEGMEVFFGAKVTEMAEKIVELLWFLYKNMSSFILEQEEEKGQTESTVLVQ